MKGSALAASLGDYLTGVVDDPDAGYAVGVLRPGEPAAMACRGLADRDTAAPVSEQTAFRICSLTKQFTALLVLIAQDEGLLSIDDHPGRYLPLLADLPRGMTLRHLCTNQSGLRDLWVLGMLAGATFDTRVNLEQVQTLLPAVLRSDTPPGLMKRYCNSNFYLLGLLLSEVLEAPFAELLATRIFEPVGLRDTRCVEDTAEELAGGAVGYEPGESGAPEKALVNLCWQGEAAVVSSLRDMLQWEAFVLGDRSPLAVMARALVAEQYLSDGSEASYRLGMGVGRYAGLLEHRHTGGLRGFRSARLHLPEKNVSVVVLLNHMRDPLSLARDVAHHTLGIDGAGLPGESYPGSDEGERLGWFCEATGLYATTVLEDDELRFDHSGSRTRLCAGGANRFHEPLQSRGLELSFAEGGKQIAKQTDKQTGKKTGKQMAGQMIVTSTGEHGPLLFSRVRPGPAPTWEGTRVFDQVEGLGIAFVTPDSIRFEGLLGKAGHGALTWRHYALATFPCGKALDFAAPGEFTLVVGDDFIEISHWMAQRVRFVELRA